MEVDMSNLVSSDENDSNEAEADSAPCGWSREDKYILLQALKITDSNEIDRIQAILPSKSTEEIAEVIAYYKKKASKHPMVVERMSKENKAIHNVAQVPLAQWAKVLTDEYTFKELETETATALRLIAEFDNIPSFVATGGVDFRSIYHAIANSIEGKALPDDRVVNAILEKCIIETAYSSKAFIRNTCFKNIIQGINLSEKEFIVFPRPTENHELGILRHLASQRRYNPLNIGEAYLKPSVHN